MPVPHIAIIGGGAAGHFAAIAAKESLPSARVTIFERASGVLAKVRVSGGGRCNLTNSFASVTDLRQVYPRGDKLLKRLFRLFDNEDAMAWFTSRGVPLVTQDDDCVFPRSQSSQSVIDALVQTARRAGVETVVRCAVSGAERLSDGKIQLSFAGEARPSESVDAVIVTVGGQPKSAGLEWLARMGQEIIAPVPSLFTFTIPEERLRQLMGVVVENAVVSVPSTKFRAQGALLVTHWGISGPATLRLSSHAARFAAERDYRFPVSVAWAGETNAERVQADLSRIASENGARKLTSVHPAGITQRLWTYLVERASLSPERRWAEVGKKGLNRLTELLTNDVYTVTSRSAFKDEFVTCGGVSLAGVQGKTLESRVVPGLYFAGEVLDVDAVTGGFNLQAAWTTGYVAGRSAAEKLSATIF